tara:strand:- start:103 stop:696 length:594 start_codon:yes stop_codon:yes gene_type:complete
MDKDTLYYMYGFIAIRVFLLYLSTNISSNIMNQIYTERVLINGEQPPKLVFQVYLFVVVDIIFNIFLIAFVWGTLNLTGKAETNILNKFVLHYVITLVIIMVSLLIITHTMYVKKYFLYQDDGLRAIRALNNIMFNLGGFISVLPFFMFVDDINFMSKPKVNTVNNSAKPPNNEMIKTNTALKFMKSRPQVVTIDKK